MLERCEMRDPVSGLSDWVGRPVPLFATKVSPNVPKKSQEFPAKPENSHFCLSPIISIPAASRWDFPGR